MNLRRIGFNAEGDRGYVRVQMPYVFQSRNHGFEANSSSCCRFAASRSANRDGLVSGSANDSLQPLHIGDGLLDVHNKYQTGVADFHYARLLFLTSIAV